MLHLCLSSFYPVQYLILSDIHISDMAVPCDLAADVRRGALCEGVLYRLDDLLHLTLDTTAVYVPITILLGMHEFAINLDL